MHTIQSILANKQIQLQDQQLGKVIIEGGLFPALIAKPKQIVKMGAPTKYDPDFCTGIIEYFSVEPYKEVMETYTYKDGTTKETFKEVADELPTLAGYAGSIGVHRDTLNQWQHDYPDFSDAIKKAKELQEAMLVSNALKGLYQSTFSIFVAKNYTGLKDQEAAVPPQGNQYNTFIQNNAPNPNSPLARKFIDASTALLMEETKSRNNDATKN